MPEAPAVHTFRLDLASRPEHVPMARLFISVVARTLAADESTVEDLKLAVSEVVSAIVIAARHEALSVVATGGPEGLQVEIGPVAAEDLSVDAVGPDPVAVIEAIFPGVEIAAGVVRFAVPTPVAQ